MSSRPTWMSLTIAFVAFVSLGLPDGVLGVAWPSIRRTFQLPLSQLGNLLAASMMGYLVSSFGSGWIVARIGVGPLLLWSSVLMVGNCLLCAVAPAWWVMVGSGVLGGFGAGAIDAGINAFAAARFPPQLVNWLHASYGVGAMLGPLPMTGVLAAALEWRWGYALIGAVLAAMAVCFCLTLGLWQMTPAAACPARSGHSQPPAGIAETLGHPLLWLNIALFFVYTGLEVTAGQWSYSLFTDGRGVAPGAAGVWVAGYWASLTAGRLVGGVVTGHLPSETLLRVSTASAPLGALMVWSDRSRLGFIGLATLGFSLAPIYPLLIAETPRRLGAAYATHAIGFQVAAAYLGTAVIPGLAGVLARREGIEVIGPVLFGTAMGLLLLQEIAVGFGRRARRMARLADVVARPRAGTIT